MFEQCPLRNSVTKSHWTGAKTSLFNAKFHSGGSCYWMAQVNLGQKKKGLHSLSSCFSVWIIQIITSLFNFFLPAWSRGNSTYLVFVFCHNGVITCNSQKSPSYKCITFVCIKKNPLIPNSYLFFYNFYLLFVIHSFLLSQYSFPTSCQYSLDKQKDILSICSFTQGSLISW